MGPAVQVDKYTSPPLEAGCPPKKSQHGRYIRKYGSDELSLKYKILFIFLKNRTSLFSQVLSSEPYLRRYQLCGDFLGGQPAYRGGFIHLST